MPCSMYLTKGNPEKIAIMYQFTWFSFVYIQKGDPFSKLRCNQ